MSGRKERKALIELNEIEDGVDSVKREGRELLKTERLLQFNEQKMFEAMLQRIGGGGKCTCQKEEYLLYKRGRFSIRSGKQEEVKFETQIPDYSAKFQANRKLYVCGGVTKMNGKEEQFSRLTSFDYEGKSVELERMQVRRGGLSLSGLWSMLIAVGG